MRNFSAHRNGLFAIPIIAICILVTSCSISSAPLSCDSRDDGLQRAFLADKLKLAEEYAEGLQSEAIVVLVGGRLLMTCGNTRTVSYIASARKSVVAMLYGKYVNNGTINLDLTLKHLGMDDVQGLTDVEMYATIKHLLTARSGVYHPASNPGGNNSPPPRGTIRPGSYFLYHNWGFNAAGTIFEKKTNRNLYVSFETDLAIPLGFDDWDRSIQWKVDNPTISRYPAHHIMLSTRDMAKLGELMRREGEWNGTQIVPKDWMRKIVSVVTQNRDMNPQVLRDRQWGYGYSWWILDGPIVGCRFKGAYFAMGTGGQYIGVIPALDMVVALKTTKPKTASWSDANSTDWPAFSQLLIRLNSASTSPPC